MKTELEKQLKKITDLRKMAQAFGGKIAVGDRLVTTGELQQLEVDLKIEIKSQKSQSYVGTEKSNLRLVK